MIRAKLGKTASKLVEANADVQASVSALLNALEQVFKPRDVECQQAIRAVQSMGLKAVPTVSKIKEIYTRYNRAFPDRSDKVLQVVSNCFAPLVRQTITTQLQLIAASVAQRTITVNNRAHDWGDCPSRDRLRCDSAV